MQDVLVMPDLLRIKKPNKDNKWNITISLINIWIATSKAIAADTSYAIDFELIYYKWPVNHPLIIYHKLTSMPYFQLIGFNWKLHKVFKLKNFSENVNIILAKMLIPLTAWGNAIVQGHPSPCVIEGQFLCNKTQGWWDSALWHSLPLIINVKDRCDVGGS